MHDADGPIVARAVYRALFHSSRHKITLQSIARILARCFSELKDAPLEDPFVETITIVLSGFAESGVNMLAQGHLSETIQETYAVCSISTEPLSDAEVEAIANIVPYRLWCHAQETLLSNFSLAHVVDDITREMRVSRKFPGSRWATFVHVGI